ncbi:MAG TPA: agmatinase [Actinomycetota bacterium]|nr:agmatinase [Actinomycetota bacterium]
MSAALADTDDRDAGAPPGPSPVGPVDPLQVPRFAGPATFARLPRLDEVERADVAVVGVPFDSGTTYRPGARFGPMAIRQASRLLRSYHAALDVQPFAAQQVADAGDIAVNPFDIAEAIRQIEEGADEVLGSARHLLALGGDHTIALPLLRVMARRSGPVALVHLDAHLDTWDTYFGAAYTHGTPFRRAWEEGLLREDAAVHVGVRGPLFSPDDLRDDERFGFAIVSAMDLERVGIDGAVERIRERVGDAPVYVSVDIDVIEPGLAPGTGTPEAGGLTTRETLGILRGLAGLPLVSADIVEVAPPYDHAEVTAVAASHVAYELLGLFARAPDQGANDA